MRWLTLYLRSRRVPIALATAGGFAALMWSLWSAFSDGRTVAIPMVVLTLLLMVAALTATLGGPDDALDKTAAFSWLPRRIAHLLAAFLIVTVVLLATMATGARFGPAWLVLRDAAGLLGLTALCAATMGTARAWFLPLGWTLVAIIAPLPDPLAGRILTWQAQAPDNTAAAVTAGLLTFGGLIAYAMAGPARSAPAEAAQH
jgi:hypothetical protein